MGLSKQVLNIQEDSRCKGIQGNTYKAEIECVCLNARSIISKKNELNIMVDDIIIIWVKFLTSVQLLKIASHPVYCG